MKNRAKCKLCQTIIESFNINDYVSCQCGEIAIDGGDQQLRCVAKNWNNFLRVDDGGNEIIPKVIEKPNQEEENTTIQKWTESSIDSYRVKREELLEELNQMIINIERLPKHVMQAPINHYDFCSLMLLLTAIFRAES